MSVIIRVSYEHEEELNRIVKQLAPMSYTLKREPQKGKWKRAYLKSERKLVKWQEDAR